MKRIEVNKDVCTGCRYCEIVCSLTHEGEVNPRKSRIRIFGDQLNGLDQPIVCDPIACKDMPCIESCPVEAIKIDDRLSFPVIDVEACIGCKACIKACPINAIFFDEISKKALKCDLCNGDPQCVKRCVANRYLPHIPDSALKYT